MTEERLVPAELLEKADEGDFLKAVAEAVLQLLMESDVEGVIGAGRYERSGERTTWRNGYRDRALDTRLGSLQLRIPTLRQGSYFPPFLEARESSEKALIAVIQEAWIGGVSTRRVDDLVQAMGLSGISKSQVSKLCKEIDERVLVAHGIGITGLAEPRRVFSGTAREAARGFPANVNVAAALALAGIGPDRTTVEIWADPTITRNIHRIEVEAAAASLSMQILNVPSDDNPRTGRLTALSVIAALKKLVSPLAIGT
jgi:hypothetical protein